MFVRPPVPTLDEVVALGREHGLDRIGVAPADVLHRARTELERRKRDGLDGGMEFTYRNPERSTDPSRTVADARSIIVAARSYLLDEPAKPDGPQARVARYAWLDHYTALRSGLRVIARRLKAAGERAVVLADDNALVDREAAYLGGLGWFGKNANLLVPGAGSWFVLGAIVTTAAYPPAEQPVRDGCGVCRRCLDRCPTGAIVAPGVIDGGRCLAWVLQRPGSIPEELRPAVGDRIYGCDDCQEACPPTVRLGERIRRPVTEAVVDDSLVSPRVQRDAGIFGPDAQPQAWVDVIELLESDDDAVLARHGRWYVADRDPRWLRRNALVVLGNTADADDRRARAVIDRYAQHADPMLADHARWARDRITNRRLAVTVHAAR